MSTQSDNHLDLDTLDLREVLSQGLSVVTELWSYPTGDWVSSVTSSDIDGDGDLEVVAGSRDTILYVLSKRGGLKWKFEKSKEWTGTVFAIDNTEAEGHARIIMGSRDNRIYGLDKDGRLLWNYPTGHVVRHVYVHDINGDGKAEVIAGSEDRSIYALECETGDLLWKYRTNGWIRTVFPADIDGDGEIEILAGSGDKNLYVLDNSQGRPKWIHDTGSKIHTIFATDLDKDGTVEILIGSDAKDLYALTPDRKRKWQFSPDNRILSIFVADIDGDGHLEVIAGSEDKHIYILDDQGQLLWKHNLETRVFSVYATDLNRDGVLEILVGSEGNSIHVLRVELVDGLLAEILACYEALGQPPTTELKVSPAERALLQDLIGERMPDGHQLTRAKAEQAIRSGEYFKALSTLLKLEKQTVELLWRTNAGHIRTVCLGDLNDDSKLEIVAGTDDGDVHALDNTGDKLWSYTIGDRVWMTQIGDVNLDGTVEVVAGSGDGHVYILNNMGGHIEWQFKMDDWIRSVYVTDPERHGRTEIVMGSEGRKIHIYDTSLSPVIEPISTPQSIRAICAQDLNADGVLEIIAGADDNNVYTYTRGGVQLWEYKTRDRVRGLFVGDIDADGDLEIVVGSEDRNVHVIDHKGKLKWRYHTPHRVLDVDALDVDNDGHVEVLVGAGDGYVYVISSSGDPLWGYKVSDRVRGVRAGDVNRDGRIEIVVGSEDRRLYIIQVLDQQQLYDQIELCWSALQQNRPVREVIHELTHHQDPYIRAFALKKLISHCGFRNEDFAIFQELLHDHSPHVRKTCARNVDVLYKCNPDQTRRFLDHLSADRDRDVRLAFVESLPAVAKADWHVGFEYLDRFTRDSDKWVRRAVVRKLHQLAQSFPQQTFRLLFATARDKKEWVRQETARTLAHYFDIHTENLIIGTRHLIAKDIDPSILDLIAHRATKPVIQRLFYALVGLLCDLDEANVLDSVLDIVSVLEETRDLKFGEETWQIYNEFYHLHQMRTVDEIAQYRYKFDQIQLADAVRFEDTLRVLLRLTDISDILRIYLRREGLGDRLASLLEATTAIETLYTDLGREYFWLNGQRPKFPDRQILEVLLTKWRAIVTAELRRLRGRAELRPELRTKQASFEQQIAIWLEVSNIGRSPADNLKVTLEQNDDFEVIGGNYLQFEMVPSQNSVLAEFTIKPVTTSPHLAFELIYDDAEAKGKELLFGDRLDLLAIDREFKHIPNPYSPGPPIQSEEMFYGREEDLEFLKQNLTFTPANMIIVLYGQRRSGKSSLLYQLVNTPILEPHIPVYIDMQGISFRMTTSTFLYKMAFAIYRRLRMNGISIDQPDERSFEKRSTFALDLYLDEVENALQNRKLVLMIDEFEILEQKVLERALTPEIFEYLRSLMQHRRGLNFLLAGVQTIEQLTADYWSVFFNIARHHRLRKLNKKAAIQLITEPVENYLEYDPLTIEKIRMLTADQPYFIQLICRSLVEHCNKVKKSYATINDVNIVLNEVMETGQVHFKWVWDRTTLEERLGMSVLAQEGGEEGRSLSLSDIEEVYQHYGLPYDHENVMRALQKLAEKDIIESVVEGTRFRISVGLIRRWLRETKTLRRVMLEEDLLG